MRILQHAAVLSAFAIIAAVIVFARPHSKTTAPVTPHLGAQVATSQK
jgi:hypothetical protein